MCFGLADWHVDIPSIVSLYTLKTTNFKLFNEGFHFCTTRLMLAYIKLEELPF